MAADGVREIVGGLADAIEIVAGHGERRTGDPGKEQHNTDGHVMAFHACLRDPCGPVGVESNGTIRLRRAARVEDSLAVHGQACLPRPAPR